MKAHLTYNKDKSYTTAPPTFKTPDNDITFEQPPGSPVHQATNDANENSSQSTSIYQATLTITNEGPNTPSLATSREPQRNISQRMAESISEHEFFGDMHMDDISAFANPPSSDDPAFFQ